VQVLPLIDAYLLYVLPEQESLVTVIEPIFLKAQFFSHPQSGRPHFLRRYEYGVDVGGSPARVIRHRHGSSTNNEQVGLDAHRAQLVVQEFEGVQKFTASEEGHHA